MNILNALKQLRDDIKAWVTTNLNALNAKIDEKTIPIDSELNADSTNPVQNKAITSEIDDINSRVGNTSVAIQISSAIAKQPHFSGDYNDLTNAPNISEDDGGNMVIADEDGNIIFKADAEGIHTTALSLNGEVAATETYVNAAIAEIPTPDVSGQIETHNISTTAHKDIRQAINTAKEELSESIVSEADEWKVVDEAGNIIFSVDTTGAHTTELTLNGENAATESYVDDAIANIEFPTTDLTDYATKEYVDNAVDSIEIPEVDFTGYATETYVDNKVADLVNSAPEALDTLGELATALENHKDAYDALLETVGGKATKAELEDMKSELSESIVSESEEWHIVDSNGNVAATISASGLETTTVAAQNFVINGESIEDLIKANESKSTFYVTFNEDSTAADKTVAEILEAYNAGYAIYGIFDGALIVPLTIVTEEAAMFILTFGITDVNYGMVTLNADGTVSESTITLAKKNDIPTKVSELTNDSDYMAKSVYDTNNDGIIDKAKEADRATQDAAGNVIATTYAKKTEEFITVADIDEICGTTIQDVSSSGSGVSEVTF